MIKIGILGTLSPLGQKMWKVLCDLSDYDVVWVVEQFDCNGENNEHVQNLENVLCNNAQNTDIVLDFADYKSTLQRVKLYRRYGVPAIVQGTLSEGEIEALSQLGEDDCSEGKQAPIMLEPDFSVVKTQMIKNLICQVHHLLCDVQRIYVNVWHHSDIESVRLPWLHWAKMINEVLGEYTDVPTSDGEQFTLGFVRVINHYGEQWGQDEEIIDIELFLDEGKGNLRWNMSCPLLDTRVDGVMQLLEWYVSEREISQDLVMGEILADALSTLI